MLVTHNSPVFGTCRNRQHLRPCSFPCFIRCHYGFQASSRKSWPVVYRLYANRSLCTPSKESVISWVSAGCSTKHFNFHCDIHVAKWIPSVTCCIVQALPIIRPGQMERSLRLIGAPLKGSDNEADPEAYEQSNAFDESFRFCDICCSIDSSFSFWTTRSIQWKRARPCCWGTFRTKRHCQRCFPRCRFRLSQLSTSATLAFLVWHSCTWKRV